MSVIAREGNSARCTAGGLEKDWRTFMVGLIYWIDRGISCVGGRLRGA